MELQLKRGFETTNSTAGTLWHDTAFLGFTIEDGHREPKIPGQTRIPAGRYRLQKRTDGRFYREYSEKFKHKYVYQLEDVPGFEAILIHIGNTVSDTRGCILPNGLLSFDKTGNAYFGSNSSACYQSLYRYLDQFNEEIYLTITNPA